MKTSGTGKYDNIAVKVMMGLVLTVLVGSMNMAPAFGDDRRGMERHDNGRSRDRGHTYYRDNDGRREYYNDRHGRRVYRTYVYRERVYVPPPPVVYAPPPPPGIRIFFPPIIFR